MRPNNFQIRLRLRSPRPRITEAERASRREFLAAPAMVVLKISSARGISGDVGQRVAFGKGIVRIVAVSRDTSKPSASGDRSCHPRHLADPQLALHSADEICSDDRLIGEIVLQERESLGDVLSASSPHNRFPHARLPGSSSGAYLSRLLLGPILATPYVTI
jgi:hypothetical protein